ncbi:MAG: S-layer homology domain-containing protein [Oscillospiraceae bacterium]|jgi:hypothetical protein|nr:S-layer homology domain-containing protein [Oscillospiraceae bacterium]
MKKFIAAILVIVTMVSICMIPAAAFDFIVDADLAAVWKITEDTSFADKNVSSWALKFFKERTVYAGTSAYPDARNVTKVVGTLNWYKTGASKFALNDFQTPVSRERLANILLYVMIVDEGGSGGEGIANVYRVKAGNNEYGGSKELRLLDEYGKLTDVHSTAPVDLAVTGIMDIAPGSFDEGPFTDRFGNKTPEYHNLKAGSKFDSDRIVTRQELALYIMNARKFAKLDSKKIIDGKFTDVDEKYKEAVNYCYSNGIMSGTGDKGKFNATGMVTEETMLVVLLRSFTKSAVYKK